MRSPIRNILIIGAGFSGTVLAARLLRQPPAARTRLLLVERRGQVGRGVAYQAGAYPYLLNVPAERMSADSRDPGQFVRFAQQRMAGAAPGDFLPRSLYGEYLEATLEAAVQAAPARITLELIRGEVHELERIDTHGPFLAAVGEGRRILADDVVLACGDAPAAPSAFARGVDGHDAYVCDPFRDGAFQPDTQTLLLIGTGLTMVDAALAAVKHSPGVRIHAISRHGLLPAVQTGPAAATARRPVDAGLAVRVGGDAGARRLLHAFRSLLGDVGRGGGDWRDAVAAVRPDIPGLWQGLPETERRRFLRHLRARWDTCRHRLPPTSAAQVAKLCSSGQLQIQAGHVRGLDADGRRLCVRWRPRGGSRDLTLLVDRAIDCTGTDQRLHRTRDPLLRGLLGSGLASADALGLGLRTDRYGLMDGDGRLVQHLFYLGPMLRSQYWEATAAGELRLHAEKLAQELAHAGVTS